MDMLYKYLSSYRFANGFCAKSDSNYTTILSVCDSSSFACLQSNKESAAPPAAHLIIDKTDIPAQSRTHFVTR